MAGVDIRSQPGRAAALEAARLRRERQEEIRSGDLAFEVLMMFATVEPATARMRIQRAVQSYPGWKATSAGDLLRQLRIPPSARLSYLLAPARADVAERLGDAVAIGPGRRPELPPQWPFFQRSDRAEGLVGA